MSLLHAALPCLALAASGPDPVVVGQELPRVLVLGTYHMDNPGLDFVNPVADDVLTERRQGEIELLVERLLAFEPTHVAVERLPSYQATLDARYRDYLDGVSTPERGETYQIAFRLAAAMGHERLHAVDHSQGMPMDAVVQRAQASHPRIATALMDRMGGLQEEFEVLMKRPVLDILVEMNSPRSDEEHGVYLLIAQVGDAEDPVGADAVSLWYERNLKIFANVARLAERPEDRVLVLIGAGHGTLLREFVRQAPNLELADTIELLQGDD